MKSVCTPVTPTYAGLNTLLSRYAESMMWLARYMERIENLARLIEVTNTFVSTNGWESIIQINADDARFNERHDAPTSENILSFYITDRNNPTSIISMAFRVRENARVLRPLISTEMWIQLNVFTQWLLELDAHPRRINDISNLCNHIKQECQSHFGITEGTLYRDQAWLFYVLGKQFERAEQITRLVDIRYHILLPPGADVGSDIDQSQWTAVLRSASAYHAFRRLRPVTMTPANMVGFMLKNDGFPRSLSSALRSVDWSINLLAGNYNLRQQCNPVQERLTELRATLDDQTADQIILRGLHEYMDWFQRELNAISSEIQSAFWPSVDIAVREQIQEQ